MITPEYCVTMARYSAWQNKQLRDFFQKLDAETLTEDRGAFFGSILGTANHLLWGDRIWLARFAGTVPPEGGIPHSAALTASRANWEIARFRTDGEILLWAERVRAVDLTGDLTWYSGANGCDMSKPFALCVTGFFNHQTHHRGQIHAMLTAAGSKAPVTDLAFMPDTREWLG